MVIKGVQKLTLLDFPNKVACTVFTPGCNFRCGFCHNAPLVTDINSDELQIESFFKFLSSRKCILDGVAITGGEPLMQNGLEEFIIRIRKEGFLVKLDTNGSFPEKLEDLICKGLVDYVAVDIKNSPEKYGETIGVQNFDFSPIQKTVDLLLKGKVDYEFRTTVTKERFTSADFVKIGELIKGAKRYFIQQFKATDTLISDGYSAFSPSELENFRKIAENYVLSCSLRGV